jgi:hypothetical protein
VQDGVEALLDKWLVEKKFCKKKWQVQVAVVLVNLTIHIDAPEDSFILQNLAKEGESFKNGVVFANFILSSSNAVKGQDDVTL